MIHKVIIPIAGYGTRMYPATKVLPKALFPMVDPRDNLVKPILYMLCDTVLHALENQSGYTVEKHRSKLKLIIVIQSEQRPFIEHFFFDHSLDHVYGKGGEDAVMMQQIERIRYISQFIELVVQEEQAGLGHAIMICEPYVRVMKNDKNNSVGRDVNRGSNIEDENDGEEEDADDDAEEDESFMLMLGDHIYVTSDAAQGSCIHQMLTVYNSHEQQQQRRRGVRNGKQLSMTSVSATVESELSVNGIVKMKRDTLDDAGRIFTVETTFEKPSAQTAEQLDLFLDSNLLHDGPLSHIENEHGRETTERQCLCFFGIDILTMKAFDYLRESWTVLQHENRSRSRKEELNLRMHCMKQLMESESDGMLGVFLSGRRCDTGLPVPYLQSMNTVFNNGGGKLGGKLGGKR